MVWSLLALVDLSGGSSGSSGVIVSFLLAVMKYSQLKGFILAHSPRYSPSQWGSQSSRVLKLWVIIRKSDEWPQAYGTVPPIVGRSSHLSPDNPP